MNNKSVKEICVKSLGFPLGAGCGKADAQIYLNQRIVRMPVLWQAEYHQALNKSDRKNSFGKIIFDSSLELLSGLDI